MKNKENLVFIVAALIVGILIGVIASNFGGNKGSQVASQTSNMAPSTVNYQQQIQVLLDVVAKEPGNRNAWVQLGNDYFDSQQPVAAVDAYAKALEINGNDPDVLTDQGIMFRQLGWYDKAIENFEKANQINPQHVQSLYHLGAVYLEELKDFTKAVEAWDRFLKINPTGPDADRVRSIIEQVRTHPPVESGNK